MSQFDRSASIIVGETGEDGIQIKDLRITFNIKKTKDKDPNTADVSIYNLSELTRNKIKKKQKIFLSAGYLDDEGESLIFIGDITEVTHTIARPDVITKIVAQDGQQDLTTKKLSFSFKGSTAVSTVIDKITSIFPFAKKFTKDIIPSGLKYQNGFSFAGPAKDALNKVLEFAGLEWSVQNNELVIVKKGESDGKRAVLLTSQTGLLGSPERFTDDSEKSKGATTKEINGWRVRSLLQPRVNPKNQISVKSREIPEETFFTVLSVVHSGDTWDGQWDSLITVKE